MVSEGLDPAKGRRPVVILIEHHAETKNIGAGVHRSAERLLRAHVLDRAQQRARF
jgi:hypothetical protein